MVDKPYFFNNSEWYKIFLDDDDMPAVKLTNVAPKEAVDSFNEYFKAKKGSYIFEVNK